MNSPLWRGRSTRSARNELVFGEPSRLARRGGRMSGAMAEEHLRSNGRGDPPTIRTDRDAAKRIREGEGREALRHRQRRGSRLPER